LLRLKINLRTDVKISELPLITEAGLLSSPTDLDGRRHFTAFKTSELEIDGNANKSGVLCKRENFVGWINNNSLIITQIEDENKSRSFSLCDLSKTHYFRWRSHLVWFVFYIV
jgi:hypothetical protein